MSVIRIQPRLMTLYLLFLIYLETVFLQSLLYLHQTQRAHYDAWKSRHSSSTMVAKKRCATTKDHQHHSVRSVATEFKQHRNLRQSSAEQQQQQQQQNPLSHSLPSAHDDSKEEMGKVPKEDERDLDAPRLENRKDPKALYPYSHHRSPRKEEEVLTSKQIESLRMLSPKQPPSPVQTNAAPPLQPTPSQLENSSQQHHIQEEEEAAMAAPPTVLYSHARPDRSGAFLQDMLFAHAYAVQNNMTYGGVCNVQGWNEDYFPQVQAVIAALGLQDVLPFACPENSTTSSPSSPAIQSLYMSAYYKQFPDIWTPEWLAWIHSHMTYRRPALPQLQDGHPYMAMHLRRGDVSPCPEYGPRYLPNSYFIDILSRYRPTHTTPVYIFSETESFEAWDEWRELQKHDPDLHLMLDVPLPETYEALVNANVLVTSRSTFSLVSGLLNPHKNILYTSFFYSPFWNQHHNHTLDWDGWTLMDNVDNHALMQRAEQRILELRAQAGCPEPNPTASA